jgi:hypothetical protein
VVDGGLPVLHLCLEPFLVVVFEFSIAVRGKTRVAVADVGMGRSVLGRSEPDAKFGDDMSGVDPDESNAEGRGIVFGHDPGGFRGRLTVRGSGRWVRRSEHTSEFGDTGVRIDQAILPAREPVGLANRAENGKTFSGAAGLVWMYSWEMRWLCNAVMISSKRKTRLPLGGLRV